MSKRRSMRPLLFALAVSLLIWALLGFSVFAQTLFPNMLPLSGLSVSTSGTIQGTGFLLLENSSFILLESGSKICLEGNSGC